MRVERTAIEGLLVVDSRPIEDSRGFFRETYRRSELERALGRAVVFGQGNHSRSAAGVLRGFHAEPWDKLVYVPRGRAFCAVADIRPQSATFGLALTFELGDGQWRRLFVARGLANAFQALEETDYVNDVSDEYVPDGRHGFAWDDPDLGVRWPLHPPLLSEADRGQPTLRSVFPDHPRFANQTAS